MTNPLNIFRDWLPTAAALCTVLVTSGYAVSKYSQASGRIQEVQKLGEGLCASSERAQANFLDPTATNLAKQENEDLRRRMEEATRPAIVQGALMAAARQSGLSVQEVIPIVSSGGPGSKTAKKFPGYRVIVQGNYSQIADFMQLCQVQRVPMRTVSFRVASAVDQAGKPIKGLKAEIAVESFISAASSEGGKQ